MATTYLVVNGMVLQEDRDGTVREYRPDTLGSTVALTDATTATDTWEYWPYGEVRSRTGSNPTPFQFVGTLGYYRDSSTRTYVRARHYRQGIGRWQTVDPLWPREKPYAYVHGMPTSFSDPSGRLPLWLWLLLIGFGILCAVCIASAILETSNIQNDKKRHCVVACLITARCGLICGGLAAIGSEIFSWLVGGDVTWDDFVANVAGVACGLLQCIAPGIVPIPIIGWTPFGRQSCEACCAAAGYA